MVKKRTMDVYKTLGSRLLVDISAVLTAQEQDKLMRAMRKVEDACSKAEDNMFLDHPELSNEYFHVFYGATNRELEGFVDREIVRLAREVADGLFPRAGKKEKA